MSTTTIKQISTENEEIYYLMAVKEEDDLTLTLTDCKQAFIGKLNLSEFDEPENDGSEIKYSKLTLSALTENNETNADVFLYQIEIGEHSITFKWKKLVAKNKVKLEVGKVRMTKTNLEETLKSTFNVIVNCMKQSSVQKNQLQLECERLRVERQKALDSLRNCTQLKNQLENDMYSKFVAVLNAKKENYSGEHAATKQEESHQIIANKKPTAQCKIPEHQKNFRTERKKKQIVSSDQDSNNHLSDDSTAIVPESQGVSSTNLELDSLLFSDDEPRKPAQKAKIRKTTREKKNNVVPLARASASKRRIQIPLSDSDSEDLLNQM